MQKVKQDKLNHDVGEECVFCQAPFTVQQKEALKQLYEHNHQPEVEEKDLKKQLTGITTNEEAEKLKPKIDRTKDVIKQLE